MANEKENKQVFEWYTKRGFFEIELSSDKCSEFKQVIKEEYQCDELKLLVLENVEKKLKLPEILRSGLVNRRFYPNPIFELTLPDNVADDSDFVRVSLPEYVYAQLSPGACTMTELFWSIDNKKLLGLDLFFRKQNHSELIDAEEVATTRVVRKGQPEKPFGFIGYKQDQMQKKFGYGEGRFV